MCLSTVIKVTDGAEEPVCSDVSNFQVEGETITFTDLLGCKTELKGKVTSVDFLDSKIFVAV